MDGVTADGVIGNNTVDEQLLSAAINDVARTVTSFRMAAPKTTTADADGLRLLTGNSFLKGLFEVQNGAFGNSVEEIMEKYPSMPLFVIFALLTADTMEGSITTTMEIIQSQQKQQKAISKSIIDETSYMQKKKEELAASDADNSWMYRVGIDVTGANRKEDSKNNWWLLIIGVGVIMVVAAVAIATAVFTGGASIGATIGVAAIVGSAILGCLMVVGSICTLIANVVKNPKHKKILMLLSSIFNPLQAIVEGAVDAHCALHDKDPNDEIIRKTRMGLNLAATIIASFLLVAAGIVGSVFSGGATGVAAIATAVADIANIVSGIIVGVTSLATGIMEIINGTRALKRAEMRKILNQVQASLERMKNILDMISINIELWTEMFSNDMAIMRGEYDRAARMLKEYNDQKVAIARNIRA